MQTVFRLAGQAGKYVLAPVGVLLLLWAGYLGLDTRAWLARSVEALGSVAELVRVTDRETGAVSFAPRVRFSTTDGRTVEFQSTYRSNPPAYSAGQSVTVLYDPREPNAAAVSGLYTIWGWSIILAAIGAALVVVGVGACARRPASAAARMTRKACQFLTYDLSTVRGALHSGRRLCKYSRASNFNRIAEVRS